MIKRIFYIMPVDEAEYRQMPFISQLFLPEFPDESYIPHRKPRWAIRWWK